MKYLKLNNRGWGLQVMLAAIFVLMIGLIIVAILIQQTFGDMFSPTDKPSDPVIEQPDKKPTDTPQYTYQELEDMVLSATKKYQKEFYQDILDGEKISVTIDRLVAEELLKEVKDVEDGTTCSGYGLFTLNDGELTYHAYLNCSNYQTIGYNEIYDFN